MPTRNNVRSAKSFAAKLVQDCEPKARSKREYELTTALNKFATMYQKLANGINSEDWHTRFVKALEVNESPANVNNAITPANVNNAATVKTSTNAVTVKTSTNAVNANANTAAAAAANNNNKRPANDQASGNAMPDTTKRVKTEVAPAPARAVAPAPAIATSFKVDTNSAYTSKVHYPGAVYELTVNSPAVVQVHHTPHAPAGPPAFVQPDDGYGDPSKKPIPFQTGMYV
ncbi:hypothetical protein QBC32DRAFT_318092 [Pseudoneurospora amorphoporcata]|uniref:Uncharacterized protein n=1 Tax=Pseudoneurospora amorphoporcata TaxID=241081 RepID=A0AAN6NNN6_9PEZI|nr:hypothetical protein QBC32DRAFT_318092 [Pseudoneurospora amorphoporcata]